MTPKETSLNNSSEQLLVPIKKRCKKLRCEWPYKWKYTTEDENNWIDEASSNNERQRRAARRGLSCLGCIVLFSFSAVNLCINAHNAGDGGDGCPSWLYSTPGKIIGCVCTLFCAAATFGPCCNQKAWDNGEYCNRCVRKN